MDYEEYECDELLKLVGEQKVIIQSLIFTIRNNPNGSTAEINRLQGKYDSVFKDYEEQREKYLYVANELFKTKEELQITRNQLKEELNTKKKG